MLKALETYLWGYRFRSRLEARWAVAFDCSGIDWSYENEGFMLPSGPYLPDFFLPDFGLWFEVKGKDADPEERQRCRELSYSDYPVLLAEGNVGERALTLFAFDLDGASGGESQWACWLTSDALLVRNGDSRICNHCWDNLRCKIVGDDSFQWRPFHRAIAVARSARFEHGQSPERRSVKC